MFPDRLKNKFFRSGDPANYIFLLVSSNSPMPAAGSSWKGLSMLFLYFRPAEIARVSSCRGRIWQLIPPL